MLLSSEPFVEGVEVDGVAGSASQCEVWEKCRMQRSESAGAEDVSMSVLKGEKPISRRAINRLMM